MHESVKAREIEEKIKDKALKKGIDSISKVVIKVGKGEGESREDIEHIVKEHMNLKNFDIVEESIVLICRNCGNSYTDIESINCPECGSYKLDIHKGMGVEVISVA
ncbi:MAG: hydrogenase/urease maturation nickel metallochaperone HypA [Elusimicrobia bacterium]|jgi:Zn finger protein HypA/HybF involved in hydrogenase expression|nr:hydrogenase/urease maturation nickel metallochaperone HypA [Elusimicrobiota bacterium]